MVAESESEGQPVTALDSLATGSAIFAIATYGDCVNLRRLRSLPDGAPGSGS